MLPLTALAAASDASSSRAARVRVISFSAAEVNATCNILLSGAGAGAFESCGMWPAVRLSSMKDERVLQWAESGALRLPADGSSLGNVGAGIAHVSMWRDILEETSFDGPTLILEGDEMPHLRNASLVAKTLSNKTFLPMWDLLYLNALRPFGYVDPAAPAHVLHVPPHILAEWQAHYNVWTSAYALQPSAASSLLGQLCEPAPHVQNGAGSAWAWRGVAVRRGVACHGLPCTPKDVWLTTQLKQPSQTIRTFAWDKTNALFSHGPESGSKRRSYNGGLLKYVLMFYDPLLKAFIEGDAQTPEHMVGIDVLDDPTIKLPRFERPATARMTYDAPARRCVAAERQCPIDMAGLVDHSMPCAPTALPAQSGPTNVSFARLRDMPQIVKGMSAAELFPNNKTGAGGALPPADARPCARKIPKIVHFVWVFSAVRAVHAQRIANYANANPAWRVLVWVDRVEQSDESLGILANASARAAGPIELMLLQDYQPCFRNPEILNARTLKVHGFEQSTNPTNLLRLEVLYLFGGLYTDTDSVAVRGFDEYGDIFRWPFAVAVTDDSCNCLFAADRGSDVLRYALDAANATVPVSGAPVVGGTGPVFWTGVLLTYAPTDWLVMDWSSTLFPTPQAVVYQMWEGSWNHMHTGLIAVCQALGIQIEVPTSPEEHNGAGQDKCRAFENGLRRNWPFLVAATLALLFFGGRWLRARRRRGLLRAPALPRGADLRALCRVTATALLFCFFSSSLIMLQKLMISFRGFRFPMFLALNGMVFSLCGAALVTFATPWAPRTVSFSRDFALYRCAPLGAISALGLYLGNLAYVSLSVSFMQMMRAGTPVLILGLSFACGLKKPSFSLVGSVLLIGLGTLLVALGELSLAWGGVLAMAGAMLCEASRLVLMEVSMQGHKLGPLEGLLYFAPFTCACLLVGVLCFELDALLDHGFAMMGAWPFVIVVHGLLGFLVNLFTVATVKQTSAISFKMISTARNAGIVLASVPFFHNPITALQCLGYVLANVGLGWYTTARLKPRSADEEASKTALVRGGSSRAAGDDGEEMGPITQGDEGGGGAAEPPLARARRFALAHLRLAYLLLQWLFLSCTIILFNQHIITGLAFPFPVTLTLCHMLVSFALLHALKLAKVVAVPPIALRLWVRKFFPIGVCFALSLWLSNAAYIYISVAFIQMIKASTPVAVLLGSFAFGLEQPTLRLAGYILIISTGIGTACAAQAEANMVGVLLQFGAVVAEALRLCLVNTILVAQGLKFSSVASFYYIAPACFLWLLPAWLFLSGEFQSLWALGFAPVTQNVGVPTLLLSSSIAVLLNLASIALIAHSSALTMNVAGVFKDLLLILWSVALSGAVVSGTQYFGYSIAVVGVWCYSSYKRKQGEEKKRAAEREAAERTVERESSALDPESLADADGLGVELSEAGRQNGGR